MRSEQVGANATGSEPSSLSDALGLSGRVDFLVISSHTRWSHFMYFTCFVISLDIRETAWRGWKRSSRSTGWCGQWVEMHTRERISRGRDRRRYRFGVRSSLRVSNAEKIVCCRRWPPWRNTATSPYKVPSKFQRGRFDILWGHFLPEDPGCAGVDCVEWTHTETVANWNLIILQGNPHNVPFGPAV